MVHMQRQTGFGITVSTTKAPSFSVGLWTYKTETQRGDQNSLNCDAETEPKSNECFIVFNISADRS